MQLARKQSLGLPPQLLAGLLQPELAGRISHLAAPLEFTPISEFHGTPAAITPTVLSERGVQALA